MAKGIKEDTAMTNKEALDYLAIARSKMHTLSKGYKALGHAIQALEIAIKAENTAVDARKDDSQVNIPLNDIRAEIGDIKDEIVGLQIRVGLLERKAEL